MNLYSKKILNSLNLDIFKIISDSAEELGVESFVVGGFVRDLILDKTLKKDIDIMCVGSGIDLAKDVQKKINSKVKINIFKRYGTAMINHGDYQIEFVGSRKESYSKDSRNPSVESGNFIVLSDGYTYFEVDNRESNNSLIFIHGFSVPSYIWDKTYYSAKEKGCKIVRLDLYGRGYSDNPNVNYNDELFARQVIELLDNLEIDKASFLSVTKFKI